MAVTLHPVTLTIFHVDNQFLSMLNNTTNIKVQNFSLMMVLVVFLIMNISKFGTEKD